MSAQRTFILSLCPPWLVPFSDLAPKFGLILLFAPYCQSQENCSPCLLRFFRVSSYKAIRLSLSSVISSPNKSTVLLCQNLFNLTTSKEQKQWKSQRIPFLESILYWCAIQESPICSKLDEERGIEDYHLTFHTKEDLASSIERFISLLVIQTGVIFWHPLTGKCFLHQTEIFQRAKNKN